MHKPDSSRPFGALECIIHPIATVSLWISILFFEGAVWDQWVIIWHNKFPMVFFVVEFVLSIFGAFVFTLYLTQSSSWILKGCIIACIIVPYGFVIYLYIRLTY